MGPAGVVVAMAVSVTTLLPAGGAGQTAQPPPQEAAVEPAPAAAGGETGEPPVEGMAGGRDVAHPSPAPSAAERLLALVNAERQAAGLQLLAPHAEIAAIAERHALDMAARGELFHNEGYFSTDVRRRLGAGALGENVARNTDLEDAHRRLMASPAHRANVMDPRFRAAGFAVVVTSEGVLYVTEDFAELRPVLVSPPTPAVARPPASAVSSSTPPDPVLRLVPATPSVPARPASTGSAALVAILVVLAVGAVLPIGGRPASALISADGPGLGRCGGGAPTRRAHPL